MEQEEVPSGPSTPATPHTPGGPLFRGFRCDHQKVGSGLGRKSLLKNFKCFSVEEWGIEEGRLPPVSCPFVSLARKVGAEFIGTFILMFAAIGSAIVNQKAHEGSKTVLGPAASAGTAVMIVIISTGHISGAHLNPSITIAFAAFKHFPWKHVPIYIIAQVVASLCGAFALKAILNPFADGGVTVPSGGYGQAFAMEFIISFNLMLVATAVSTDTRAVGELAGIAVGATVMLNILIAGETSGASMNPVRTIGPAVAANNYTSIWIYLTAPFLGALCGAGTYTIVKLPEAISDAHNTPTTPRSFGR